MDRTYTQDQTIEIAQSVLATIATGAGGNQEAVVVGLVGDLGAGKTTLVQALATILGVTETVVSPTFTIAKFYETRDPHLQKLVHIDAYRIEDVAELKPLAFDAIIHSPNTLVVIEWPERITEAMPETTEWFDIEHQGDMRRITKR